VEQRILEESRRLPEFGAVSGWAALRFHGVAYCDGLDRRGNQLPVPLVVPPGTPMRGHPGILVHRERLDRGDVTVVLGVPCTRPARAAFDAARRASDLREAVVALDVALAVGVITPESFRRLPPHEIAMAGSTPRHLAHSTSPTPAACPRWKLARD
jgi:hypothetical protein